jgi:integrase
VGQRPVKLPRYVHAFIDRHGRARFYLRRKGRSKVPLPGLPWSPAFMEVYERALAACQAPGAVVIGASRTMAGTLNAAVVAYYQSAAFKSELGEGTQSSQRSLVERFRTKHGDKRLRKLERRHMQAYISSLQSPAVQRNMLRALRHLLKFCTATGLIDHDPTEGVTRAKMKKTGGFYTWTEDDVAKFEERHPVGSKARLALALYLNLGVRKSDVVRIGPRLVKNGELNDFLPQKGERTGGNRITVPLFEDTKAIIAATPITGADTYLVTSFGKTFTANGFGNKMREWCDEAGLPECTSHGLRKLCLVRLAEAGLDAFRIAAISGHKDLREVQLYVEAANRKRMARDAVAQFQRVQKKNKKMANLEGRLANPGK